MEILGGIVAGLVLMALLAGVGLAAIVALALMGVLYFLTELDFKKVFLISSGVGLLAPVILGLAISGAIADGSIERDLRTELGDIVQLPGDVGDRWAEALPKLREIGEATERGELSEEEAAARAREILGEAGDIPITINLDGDGVVTGEIEDGTEEDAGALDSGVPLELPEAVEVGSAPGDGEQ
ncbi:MAG: hypothetical protein ABJ205_14400 [Erythrobacter sp.]|uniref:hypothetical protein n=1 Tax=Erythrobacter sp. TaxID=1042 RepID=UPI00326528B5